MVTTLLRRKTSLRGTEYCKELYNHQIQGDPDVLQSQESTNDDDFQILREEVKEAIKALKTGKAADFDISVL